MSAHWENFPTVICIHTPCSGLWLVEGLSWERENHGPEGSWAQPEVTRFGMENCWPGGKRDRGLRERKERTCRDVDMTYPLARVENHWPVGKNRSWTQGGAKTTEKRGLKVQSPIQASGVVPGLKKKKRCHVGKQKMIYSKGSVTSDHMVIHFNCVPF